MKKWALVDANKLVIDLKIEDESNVDWLVNNLGEASGVWVLLDERDACAVGEEFKSHKAYPAVPKPFPSWVLNSTGLFWEPPVPYPDDLSVVYRWSERTRSWRAK